MSRDSITDDIEESTGIPSSLTRRRLIKLSGVGGLGMIAGCGSQADGGDGEATPTTTKGSQPGSSGEIIDNSNTPFGLHYIDEQFNRTNLNPYNPNSTWGLPVDLNALYAKPSPTHQEVLLHNVESEEFKGEEVDGQPTEYHVTFKQPLVWDDGTPAGAKDAVVQYNLRWYMNDRQDREGMTIQDYRADGHDTMIIDLEPPYNPTAVFYSVLTGFDRLQIYRKSKFSDYLEQFESATSDSERENIRRTVVNDAENFGMADYPTSGPWNVTKATAQELTLELNEDHWAAATQGGPLNFKHFRFLNLGDQSPVPGFRSGKIHMDASPLPQGTDGLEGVEAPTALEYGGIHMILNWQRDEWYAKTPVRQGLAYVIDREAIASNVGSAFNTAEAQAVPKPVPQGFPPLVKETVPDLWKQLRAYDHSDQGLSEAESLFEEAGLQKDGGQWYKPNGDPFAIPLMATQSSVPIFETVKQNFEDFGIKTSMEVLDGTQAEQRIDNNEFAVYTSDFGENAYLPLNYDFEWGTDVFQSGLGRGESRAPKTLTTPWPPGDWDGDPKEMDMTTVIDNIPKANKESESKKIARQLVWVAHYHMISYPLITNASKTPTKIDGPFKFPPFNYDPNVNDGWVTKDDPIEWGVDMPENTLMQGVGGGIQARPNSF